MLRKIYVLCLLAFLPISANAISTVSVANSNCSGELTASTLDGASFACAGNFTFTDGFVTSDSLINISATGDLFLDNLVFTAPNVSFSVLTGMLTVGSSVVINTSATIIQNKPKSILTWSDFNIPQGSSGAVLTIGDGGNLKVGAGTGYVLNPGNPPPLGGTLIIIGSGNLTTTGSIDSGSLINITAVPEPSTYAMMLAGILGLISFRRRI